MALITDLPNELLEAIAVAYRDLLHDNGLSGKALLDFSMACRAFYRVGFRYVYDTLDLAEKGCTAGRVIRFLELVQRNPERGYAVQRLSIGPWDPTEHISGIPKTESFHKCYRLLKRTIDTGKLHDEDMDDLKSYPCSLLVAVLFYLLPNIDYLYLGMTPTGRKRSSGTRWLVLAMSIAKLPCYEKVTDVTLEYLSGADNLSLIPCRLTIGSLLELPNLECLWCGEDEASQLEGHLTHAAVGSYPLMGSIQDANPPCPTGFPLEVAEAYNRFLEYDPMRMDKILALQGKSGITEISFYNTPCSVWPVPEIVRAARNLKEFDDFIGSKTRDTREQVLAMHQALLAHKETVTDITLSYYKGFENRHTPNFQLDFSKFEKLETLHISVTLLADIEVGLIEMRDLLPPSLETLCLKIRHTTPIPGPHRWDQAVLEVLKHIAMYKDRKLEKLKTVDLRVINHPSRPSQSRNLGEARELMRDRGIQFTATTYDAYKGTIEL
ncbi:hypothetical protein ABW19_dt0207164 [Dactylella cylindrospora]|nr:hypothetical protein ABW19_dt0207164 [Dactylella cylindrospora]